MGQRRGGRIDTALGKEIKTVSNSREQVVKRGDESKEGKDSKKILQRGRSTIGGDGGEIQGRWEAVKRTKIKGKKKKKKRKKKKEK